MTATTAGRRAGGGEDGRPMAQRLYSLAAAASLALCVAACVLWARSQRHGWLAYGTGPRAEVQLGAARGELWAYAAADPPGAARGPPGFRVERFDPPTGPREWGYGPREIPYHVDVLGLAVGSGPYATVPGRTAAVAVVPCWAAALAAGCPPLLWLRGRRRRRRTVAAGHCAACGYDLRASPGRCPECGAEPNGAA